jgi:dihydropteroate synthase
MEPTLIRCLQVTHLDEAIRQLREVGVEAAGLKGLEGKALHLNLRIEGLDPRTASHLKQEALATGADAAVGGQGLDCHADRTDVLLMASRHQLERLLLRTDAIPGLRPVGRSLRETLHSLSRREFSLRFPGRTVPLEKKTLLMGVLNVTPDSFSDGGLYLDGEKAVARGLEMAGQGADLLDVGGESTRPGSKPVSSEEECKRVLPVVESLARRSGIPVSIDTWKSSVAVRALDAGAGMINDVSGLKFDPGLAAVAAESRVPLVLMHTRGRPETMQQDLHYDSLFSEILRSLRSSIRQAESAGVDPDQIVVDPGIGFGKTTEHNLEILRNLSEFQVLGKPVLLGTSRKSFIGKVLGCEAGERLIGTLSSLAIAVMNGAHILRVHDVAEARKAVALADAVRNAG